MTHMTNSARHTPAAGTLRHLVIGGLLTLAVAARASEWLTYGGDAQRTGWAKDEKILSKDSLRNFGLQWKLHLDNEPKELSSLTAPVIMEDVYTAKGVKDILVVAGSSDNLYAIDADLGRLLWSKKFTADAKPKQHNALAVPEWPQRHAAPQ